MEEVVFSHQNVKSVCAVWGGEAWPLWWASVGHMCRATLLVSDLELYTNALYNATFLVRQNWYRLCNTPTTALVILRQSLYHNLGRMVHLRYHSRPTVNNSHKKFNGVLVIADIS